MAQTGQNFSSAIVIAFSTEGASKQNLHGIYALCFFLRWFQT
jgi:hypothetical protein